MTTTQQILKILDKTSDVRIAELVHETGASRQMVHRALKELIEQGRVIKVGTAPRTFYKLDEKPDEELTTHLPGTQTDFLEKHFLVITETGSKLSGIEAFHHWCYRRNLPLEKTAKEFIATKRRYLRYCSVNGLISGMEKLKGTRAFSEIGPDEVFYLDFYAIERFGKTKLGTLLHFAKQGQDRKLMNEIFELIKARVHSALADLGIHAVGYIPPTIKREVQFMKVLEQKLNLPLPHIDLVKVTGEVVVPQKGLSKIEDRINNARFSIMVREERRFEKVLLIDDAIGSGATVNETAIKLKSRKVANTVVGMAVTGSFKGFEVIQEI